MLRVQGGILPCPEFFEELQGVFEKRFHTLLLVSVTAACGSNEFTTLFLRLYLKCLQEDVLLSAFRVSHPVFCILQGTGNCRTLDRSKS